MNPVNALQFRPCRVLATVLFNEVLRKALRRRRAAAEQRYPHGGEPRA